MSLAENKLLWWAGVLFGVWVLLAIGFAVWFFQPTPEVAPALQEPPVQSEPAIIEPLLPVVTTIGTSVEGREITAYQYGTGDEHLLLVGGIHGGYEWNSVLLSYEIMDYLAGPASTSLDGLTVTVIPLLNPDGLAMVLPEGTDTNVRFAAADVITDVPLGTGRFNSNEVDLNRNFDCEWQPESSWQGRAVSAGTEAFSEPEAAALRDYIRAKPPVAAVFYHSKANAVYASECEAGVLSQTLMILDAYATAAEYLAVETFDAYPVTGDVEGWLASINIPAVTVELETRTETEWERNRAGLEALFDLYRPTPVSI